MTSKDSEDVFDFDSTAAGSRRRTEAIGGRADDDTVIAEIEDDAPRNELLEFDDLAGGGAEEESSKKVSGWGRVFRGNKGLWVTAAVAAVALAAGLLVGHFVISPADAANNADAPKAGLMTVPVEYGELSNDVTIRSDVSYADSVEVKLDTTSFTGGAVVTGQVPTVGQELKALSIAAEVAGRPVIVLPGDLPSYRTLRLGVSGPDVLQLKQALQSVGINPGDVNSNVFDQALADGIGALYAQAGYPAPTPEEGADETYKQAEKSVAEAQSSVSTAQAALDKAGSGNVDAVALKQADNAIATAQRALSTAEAAVPRDENAVADAKDALSLAQVQRDELFKTPDTTAEQAALTSAQTQLTSAEEALADAREAVQPFLPSSEVLFLGGLPRMVNQVNIARGKIVDGVAFTVSGASLELKGTVAPADGKLLQVGTAAKFTMPDDSQVDATISKVEPGKTTADKWTVTLTPAALTPDLVDQIQGTNVRVQIPVGATDGEVLSVPPSALTAGPGGESRVEVVEGDPKEGEKAKTRLVTVKTGLAADGYVEITPVEGKLEKGDLVVVGS